MRSNPLFRALRVDKLTYAALEATLLAYLKQDYDAIPVLRMIRLTKAEIGRRAEVVQRKVQATGLVIELADGGSAIGGGAAPGASLPTRLLAVSSKSLTASELAARLRAYVPPVIVRVEQGRLLLDLRTVFPEQDEVMAEALVQVASA
jgi:L-seryl-tRNA(Ser) seleniumtransferase